MNNAGISLSPFVRALSLTGFDEFATSVGLNSAEMLRRASLPADILRRQDGIISYRRYCDLLELCARQSGKSLFGLHYGLHQGITVFGDLLYLIRNTGSVGDALTELRANFSLYNGAANIDLDVQGKQAVLSFRVNDANTPGRYQAEELACGVAVQLMRKLVGGAWQPDKILLGHSPLDQAPAYMEALRCRPTFSSYCTGLAFDAATLALPLSTGDEGLRQMIADHLGRIERLAADELPQYIRQLLRDLLPSGRATVEKVADCLALHPRVLQRRLTQEGTSFQNLLDGTRQDMARHYLQDPTISMAQLAGLLGYSNPSGFSRAFHRWFNATPLEWQRQQSTKRQPRLLRGRRAT